MNKWKIAFWCCLTLFIIVTGFSFYSMIDQGVTLTYQKEGYIDTEQDLDDLITFINKTDFSKSEIENTLKDHFQYEFMDFKTDTISLNRIELVFENDKLERVIKRW